MALLGRGVTIVRQDLVDDADERARAWASVARHRSAIAGRLGVGEDLVETSASRSGSPLQIERFETPSTSTLRRISFHISMSVCTLLPFCSPPSEGSLGVGSSEARGWSGAAVFDDHKPVRGAAVFDDRSHPQPAVSPLQSQLPMQHFLERLVDRRSQMQCQRWQSSPPMMHPTTRLLAALALILR